MKIVSVKATPVNIPFRAPYVFSYGSIASLTKTVVEVQTDADVVGLGEVADGDRAADVMAMGERLAGLDIRQIGTAERRCLPGMRYTPWGNIQGMRRAFGGIEMALWDARGRIEGLPLTPEVPAEPQPPLVSSAPQAQPAPVMQVKAEDQEQQSSAPAPQAKQEPKPLKPKDEQAEADAMIDAILADMEKAQDQPPSGGGAQ